MKSGSQRKRCQVFYISRWIYEMQQNLSHVYQKLHKSNTFMKDLEKLLEKLRHQEYLQQIEEPLNYVKKTTNLMNETINAINQAWRQINEYEQQIISLQQKINNQKKVLKEIYKVTVLRA